MDNLLFGIIGVATGVILATYFYNKTEKRTKITYYSSNWKEEQRMIERIVEMEECKRRKAENN
jgi:hypothetical protein